MDTAPTLTDVQARYEALRARGLKLNMQRGQPSDADFDLSNGLLAALGPADFVTDGGLDVRNYPGGAAGLPEARALFGEVLGLRPEQTLVWNNASLELQAHVLTLARLRGLPNGAGAWGGRPKMVVTTPGYDRHFLLLETLGFELVTVAMQPDGPDVDAIEVLARDPEVKGVLFVPTYSNPGGETISASKAARLAALDAAAPDFTIFADDAYRVHHLFDTDRDEAVNFVSLCADAGRPHRAFVFSSTSKVTFAGAGLGFLGSSAENVKGVEAYLGAVSIGPNKAEQWRHVKFLRAFPDGVAGLMREHARLLAPKFAAVEEILSRELGGTGLATWSRPKGGYFVGLDTAHPIADRVVRLAAEAGVSLTPAGATYPVGRDPFNRNIRLAPTRPPLDEVRAAMEVVAVCVKLASRDF